MRDTPKLVIFAADPELVASVKVRFSSQPNITVMVGNGPQITARCKLDAIWMSVMLSSYYGVAGALPPHVGKVFQMSSEGRKKGLPPLLITGAALIEDRQYTPRYLARIRALALADAIAKYNQTHDTPILRVGSNPHNLGLDDLSATEAFRAVGEAFAASNPEADSAQTHVKSLTV